MINRYFKTFAYFKIVSATTKLIKILIRFDYRCFTCVTLQGSHSLEETAGQKQEGDKHQFHLSTFLRAHSFWDCLTDSHSVEVFNDARLHYIKIKWESFCESYVNFPEKYVSAGHISACVYELLWLDAHSSELGTGSIVTCYASPASPPRLAGCFAWFCTTWAAEHSYTIVSGWIDYVQGVPQNILIEQNYNQIRVLWGKILRLT